MSADRLASKMTVDLAGMTIDTHTDRAMIEMTSDPVAIVEVVLAIHMSAAANRVTTHEAHRPRTATTIAAVTEPGLVLAVAAEVGDAPRLRVVATDRAQGVRRALIGTFQPEGLAEKLRLEQQLRRQHL
jgi:hypothetical protein